VPPPNGTVTQKWGSVVSYVVRRIEYVTFEGGEISTSCLENDAFPIVNLNIQYLIVINSI
jgi:hypothetical protein